MTKKEHSLMKALLDAYIYPIGIYQSEYYGGDLEANVREALRNPVCTPETNVELEGAAHRAIIAIKQLILHKTTIMVTASGTEIKSVVRGEDLQECILASQNLHAALRQCEPDNGPPVDGELPT